MDNNGAPNPQIRIARRKLHRFVFCAAGIYNIIWVFIQSGIRSRSPAVDLEWNMAAIDDCVVTHERSDLVVSVRALPL